MKKIVSLGICLGLMLGTCIPSKTLDDSQNRFVQGLMEAGVSIFVLVAATYLGLKAVQYLEGSPWKIHKKGTVRESFDSIAGNDNAKEELLDIVKCLKNPFPYRMMGATIPKGILLEGPPGTGKTLLARALAGEANCTFISVSGSEFMQMYVGVGAARVRSLFKIARAQGPCIIFIDEIDALIKKRSGAINGHDEQGQTLNELLTQMDGFEKHHHPLIIIGATNRADAADPAALRPGRFDRLVHVGLPTRQDREKILALHAQKIQHTPNIDLAPIAGRTPGFSGADLANLINEAAIIAINKSKNYTDQSDLEAALDKIIMGKTSKNIVISEEEKRVTAYHEAGHTLAHILLNTDKTTLHKVSIMPRGSIGGHTAFLPHEKQFATKQEFINRIVTCFGGRAAEQIIFNTTMTGPSHDIQAATNLARTMVCVYGMSDKIGPVAYQYQPDIALAPYAPNTLSAIDQEVRALLEECYQQAITLLTQNKSKLDKIAQALIEKEELSAQELYALLGIG